MNFWGLSDDEQNQMKDVPGVPWGPGMELAQMPENLFDHLPKPKSQPTIPEGTPQPIPGKKMRFQGHWERQPNGFLQFVKDQIWYE